MNIKGLFKLIILAAAIVAGVQFSLVYVNRTQLKSIMESEALDARRAGNTNDDELIRRISERAVGSNITLPDHTTYLIDGLGERDEDLVITANYTHTVDLFVTKVPLKMTIVARADAPN